MTCTEYMKKTITSGTIELSPEYTELESSVNHLMRCAKAVDFLIDICGGECRFVDYTIEGAIPLIWACVVLDYYPSDEDAHEALCALLDASVYCRIETTPYQDDICPLITFVLPGVWQSDADRDLL